MKILSKLDNTGMIEETADKRYVSDAEKSAWNAKADKTYVDNKVKTNVPAGAKFTDTNTTYSEISTAEIDAGTASTGRAITGRRVKYILDKISNMISVAIGALTKSSVGLGNVDNTSDANKPISTATKAALDGKANKSQVLTNVPSGAKFTDTIYTHPSTHPASMITGLPTKLPADGGNSDTVDGKHASDFATSSHNHNLANLSGTLLSTVLREPPYVTGSITPTAKPLFDVLRADRTAFLPADQIIIEQSIDGGATWTDANVSDSTKRKFFTGQRPSVRIPLKNGVKSTDCMLRVTITGMKYNVPVNTKETEKYNYWNSNHVTSRERYFSAQEGWTWVSANSDRIYLKVEKATGGNSNSWSLDREAYLSGWSGGNYFSLSGSTFGGSTNQTGNTWNWRFTFRTCSVKSTFNDADLSTSNTTSAQSIHHMKISGQSVWGHSNNYMYHDHLYNWDEYQNATFPAEIKGSTFRKSDGTEVAYKTEIPSALSELSKNINFDERYYTETEVDAKLNGKVDKSQVLTNVPANAKFTDTNTVTTINGKTGAITKADITALGIPAQDTKYSHPSSHPASMITESSTRRFVSDSEKSTWNSKPNTDTVTTINGKTGAISKADIVALGIPSQNTNTTYSEITTAEIDAGTSSTLRTITGRRVKYILDKVQGWISGLTKSDVGLGNVDNLSAASIRSGTTKANVGLSNVDNVKQMPISGGVLENYSEKLVAVSVIGTTSGVINLGLGNVFQDSPSGRRTYSIVSAVSGQAHSFTLIINMGSTATTLTFPPSIKWQGEGKVPNMTATNKTYVLTFMSVDGGTTWLGMFGGEF